MNKKARKLAKEQGISYMQALQAISSPKPVRVEDAQPLTVVARCPLCHAVFAPTPELLSTDACPACGAAFGEETEWEEA